MENSSKEIVTSTMESDKCLLELLKACASKISLPTLDTFMGIHNFFFGRKAISFSGVAYET